MARRVSLVGDRKRAGDQPLQDRPVVFADVVREQAVADAGGMLEPHTAARCERLTKIIGAGRLDADDLRLPGNAVGDRQRMPRHQTAAAHLRRRNARRLAPGVSAPRRSPALPRRCRRSRAGRRRAKPAPHSPVRRSARVSRSRSPVSMIACRCRTSGSPRRTSASARTSRAGPFPASRRSRVCRTALPAKEMPEAKFPDEWAAIGRSPIRRDIRASSSSAEQL